MQNLTPLYGRFMALKTYGLKKNIFENSTFIAKIFEFSPELLIGTFVLGLSIYSVKEGYNWEEKIKRRNHG